MSKAMLSIVLLCSCATPAKPAESEAAEKIAIPPKNTTYPIFVEAETAEEEALNSEEQKRVDENCLGGAPKKLKSFGATTVIGRREYALEHSSTRKIALWVCEHLTKEEVITEVAHRSIKCGTKAIQLMKFFPDPRLEAGKRAELADYEGYGYDRGHMAPSDDFQSRWGAMEESFYLSNMAPQVGQGFNRSVWAKLEGHVRDYAEKYGRRGSSPAASTSRTTSCTRSETTRCTSRPGSTRSWW